MTDITPPYININENDLDKFFEKILKNDTLKDTTFEYCTSILNYLPNTQIFDFPIWTLF